MLFDLSIKELIGIIAGIVSFFAYLPYIYSIVKRETKPSRSSWWIWSFVGFLILLSYYQVGARNTIWIPVVFFICPLIIAVLSLKYGAGDGLSKLDKVCLFVAASSLVSLIFFKIYVIVLLVNIFIDFIGFLPTFQKTYKDPKNEDYITWNLFFIASILNLIALESYSFLIILYPLYMLITDIIMIYLLRNSVHHFHKKITC